MRINNSPRLGNQRMPKIEGEGVGNKLMKSEDGIEDDVDDKKYLFINFCLCFS